LVDGYEYSSMRELLLDLAAEPDVVSALRIAEKLRFAAPRSSESDVRALVGAVGDADPIVAVGALHAVAGVAHSGVDRVLVASLDDARGWVREHAAWALSARRPQRDAVAGLLRLHGSGSDLTAMVAQRTLGGWASSDPDVLSGAIVSQFRVSDDVVVRRRLVDTLSQLDTSAARTELLRVAGDDDEAIDVRAAAISAFSGDHDLRVRVVLRRLANESSEVAIFAILALFELVRDVPDDADRTGLRIGQLSVTGELDGRSSHAGAGDTGGIASLLESVSRVLATRGGVGSVLSIGRSSPEGEVASLLLPDLGDEGFASVSFGPLGEPPALGSQWDFRVMVERAITRCLMRRSELDVLHLRMADVGTLAAASVARRFGIRTVFTCAPDPHGPIAQRQAAGSITRENFGVVDAEEHLWFRARMVERLVGQADHVVLFPRRDVSNVIESVMGVDRQFLDHHSTVAPEGIDLDAIDRAAARLGTAPVVDEIVARLPAERLGRALVVSVGRLHPVKGMTRLVGDWLANSQLTESTNLVIVGGDLDRPNPAEKQVLDEIQQMIDADPAGAGVVLLGARQPSTVADVLTAATHGVGAGIAARGVYANGAPKEEFGLAVLEALAAGLPVVAPAHGGPATYVDVDVTGVLVAPDEDLGPALVRALGLHCIDHRAAAARDMIAERYTVGAYADALLGAYRSAVIDVGASSL
jgi:glycosyltransferase involved in cell wall biosynthesis